MLLIELIDLDARELRVQPARRATVGDHGEHRVEQLLERDLVSG